MTNNTSSLKTFNSSFHSVKKPTKHGFGLFTTIDLPAKTVVQQFIGTMEFPESDYSLIPVEERAHCLLHRNNDAKTWVWLVPTSDARPNAYINESLELVLLRDLKADEEITFLYNSGEEDDTWDDLWSFQCGCGEDICQGMIDRYRPVSKLTGY